MEQVKKPLLILSHTNDPLDVLTVHPYPTSVTISLAS